ncbi:MAG: sulfatase-like hydrolase/transferase [Deltaproteobacteria bacterium]|nr:sulfatase-like hydrolase/transferase [Deltaproteobacteria bacterium]
MPRPRNIVVIVADSLRWDSVYGGDGPRLPYVSGHSKAFTAARSAGCWTLPATASMFTGLLPHEHGADSQTRGLDPGIPTLAGRLRDAGYSTHQVTANVATTEIFGLDHGFDEIVRIWKEVPPQHRKLHELMLVVGKPRLRKRVLSTDWIRGKLSEDIEAGKVWLQDTIGDVFDRARRILAQNTHRGRPSFLFLNLMETHFPYHVSDILAPLSKGTEGARELVALYHVVNQTFMRSGEQPIDPAMMRRIKSRQRVAWERIAPQVDDFCRELHEGHDNLVVFGSDHGDCFGEQDWVYHFANVSDGGNRVPLFWMNPGRSTGEEEKSPVSARNLFEAVLREAAVAVDGPDPVSSAGDTLTALESCWYNCQGATLPRFKYNQFCFVNDGVRFVRRDGNWYTAAASTLAGEAPLTRLQPGIDPVAELALPVAHRTRLRRMITDFEAFSTRIS